MKLTKHFVTVRDIVILPADKGKATVVMNSLDYKQKLKNLLDDTSVYEVLKKGPYHDLQEQVSEDPQRVVKGGDHFGQNISQDISNLRGRAKVLWPAEDTQEIFTPQTHSVRYWQHLLQDS